MRDPSELPLKAPIEKSPPTLAPAWVALLCPWLGVVMLIASIVFIFLPGASDPKSELTHQKPYSLADRFLPVPMYGITITLFLSIVVLWQMRKETRPLPDALAAQRVQAFTGITLSLLSTAIVYVWVALHGPR